MARAAVKPICAVTLTVGLSYGCPSLSVKHYRASLIYADYTLKTGLTRTGFTVLDAVVCGF